MVGERGGGLFGEPPWREIGPGFALEPAHGGARAVHDGDRHRACDPGPIAPAREIGEIVGAHDPDEAHARAEIGRAHV